MVIDIFVLILGACLRPVWIDALDRVVDCTVSHHLNVDLALLLLLLMIMMLLSESLPFIQK